MQSSQQKALSSHRRRLRRKGIVRVEVQVRKTDAPLVRRIAQALSDPRQEHEIRALLNQQSDAVAAKGFKAFLAAVPLDGIELERRRDLGRDVEL